MEKQMLKSSRLVIVLTHRIKEVILGFNFLAGMQDKIQVIPCCTDTGLFSCVKNDKKKGFLQNLEGKLLFIYTGSLGTWYNLEGMLDFFKVAKQKNQNSHCVILSPGNQSYIKEMVARKGMIVDDFTLGEADYREIPDFLVRCDVGLIFYKQSFSRLACSPIKLSEYLSCGLPVIISSGVGDTEKIIRENRVGSVINEYSEHCYRVALDEILEIKKNSHRLKADCRRVAEEYFSLEKGAMLYRKIYDKFMLTG